MKKFTNLADGLQGLAYPSKLQKGTWACALRDLDADIVIDSSTHGITEKDACELAKLWADLPADTEPDGEVAA